MSLEKEIKELEEAYTLKRIEANTMRKELCDLKLKRDLPDLKSKYEGKYFICDSSYKFYLYCNEVTNGTIVRGSYFAIKNDDYDNTQSFVFEIKINNLYDINLLSKEITKEEYFKEWDSVYKQINQMRSRQDKIDLILNTDI